MGAEFVKPPTMTWAEWMCELMCGDPEPEDDDWEDDDEEGTTEPFEDFTGD